MASTLLAGAFAAAEVLVVFAAVEPDGDDAVVGCTGAIAVTVDPPLDLVIPPRVSGAATREVAVVLTGAVAAFESGSDPSAAVVAAPADGEEPFGELVCGPVPTTTPARAERVAGCDDADGVADADIDVTWLIGDLVDVLVDPDAVDGAEVDGPDAASVPEVAAPFDDEVESDDAAELVDDDPGEADDVEPEVSARATPHPHPVKTAAPTPKATANPPTRPTYGIPAPSFPPTGRTLNIGEQEGDDPGGGPPVGTRTGCHKAHFNATNRD